MAHPVRVIPKVTGSDAKRLSEALQNNMNNRVSAAERKKLEETFNSVMKHSKESKR